MASTEKLFSIQFEVAPVNDILVTVPLFALLARSDKVVTPVFVPAAVP